LERGGLYMECVDGHVLTGDELKKALAVHNDLRVARGQDVLPISYYTGDSPQRMWGARITHLWVNGSQRDSQGHIVQDIRTEVSASDLLAG